MQQALRRTSLVPSGFVVESAFLRRRHDCDHGSLGQKFRPSVHLAEQFRDACVAASPIYLECKLQTARLCDFSAGCLAPRSPASHDDSVRGE